MSWIKETVAERVSGAQDYKWAIEVTIPANQTLIVDLVLPSYWVWFERGYRFDVDQLDILKVTHFHDERLMFENLVIGAETLDLPYTKWEVVEKNARVVIVNEDDVDHWIKVVAFYRAVPRHVFNQAKIRYSLERII